ncbi:conserved hypothetical protein [Ricinus communis]|uniref:Uncharacterized protein n=1 Tax=Ricinus communis TaxID=3988 RepID=B9SAA7_RICCO|nr:conserved hypothetical protein [Ricinus communis]
MRGEYKSCYKKRSMLPFFYRFTSHQEESYEMKISHTVLERRFFESNEFDVVLCSTGSDSTPCIAIAARA